VLLIAGEDGWQVTWEIFVGIIFWDDTYEAK